MSETPIYKQGITASSRELLPVPENIKPHLTELAAANNMSSAQVFKGWQIANKILANLEESDFAADCGFKTIAALKDYHIDMALDIAKELYHT